jgi:hypothetical protein
MPHLAGLAPGLDGPGHFPAQGRDQLEALAGGLVELPGLGAQGLQGKDRNARAALVHRRVAEDLFGGKGQDGGHVAHEHKQDAPQGRLGRTPFQAVPGRDIQPVLQDIEIKRRQIRDAQVVQGVEDLVELVGGVGLGHAVVFPGGRVRA